MAAMRQATYVGPGAGVQMGREVLEGKLRLPRSLDVQRAEGSARGPREGGCTTD
jgi:hypothetical protein